MRHAYALAGLVVGVGVASADPPVDTLPPWEQPNNSGVFIDVGGGWMRADPDGMTYRAEYLRFAPQVSLNRWVYLGAAFELGRIYGSSGTLNGMLPSVCSGNIKHLGCTAPSSGLVDETSGTISEPQLFVGVRDLIGIVSGGFEIAPTERRTTASVNSLNQSFTTYVTTIELHARVDVWLTPRLTAGVTVGSDFDTVRDLQAGLQMGFHLEPYDAMNRGH
jgi:hypothetical protein